MIEISEPINNLIKAWVGKLYLYAPLGVFDAINLEARYWAKEPRSKNDVKLCDISAFEFTIKDKNILQLTYKTLIPETWAEAQIKEEERVSQLRIENTRSTKRKPFIQGYYLVIATPQEFFMLFLKTVYKKPHLLVAFLRNMGKSLIQIYRYSSFSKRRAETE